MANAAVSRHTANVARAGTGAAAMTGARVQELRLWLAIGLGALAVAGAFAVLLAISRVPGIERVVAWPLGFFGKGLVIHVVFSLVVWFLAVFALIAAMAAYELGQPVPKCQSFGQIGAYLVLMSFPLLFMPAFLNDSTASLNNYVPVIVHRGYYLGLVLLAMGVGLPAARVLANQGETFSSMSPIALAATAGSVIYVVALTCFALALGLSWGSDPTRVFHEHLFWGGGHILQFLYALLMISGWFTLLETRLGREAADRDIFRLAAVLLAVFTLPAPLLYKLLAPFSPIQQEAFRRLQFVVAFPSLIVAVSGLTAVLRARARGPLPWKDPAFLALVLSPLVFGVGGVMGLVISGSDTRTPAHYHAVIAGVNLAVMGLISGICLPVMNVREVSERVLRRAVLAFGSGQFIACIGLFLAGGYGAPRKTPGGADSLVNGAQAGMFLHGIGALIAVIGGVMFVAALIRALRRTAAQEAAALAA